MPDEIQSQASLWMAAAKSITEGKAVQQNRPTLESMISKRQIFEGMSWLFYSETGAGKTFLSQSGVLTGREVYIVDTETRAIDTRDVQFAKLKEHIHVCEPVVIHAGAFVDSTNLTGAMDAIDLVATFDRMHNFLIAFALDAINGKIPKNAVLVIESVTDLWQWIQHSKQTYQAGKKGKRLDDITDEDIEWTPITDAHNKIILALNSLRSLGFSIIYTARLNDAEGTKSRAIRSQKDLPYSCQNIMRLDAEMRGAIKVYTATAEKLLGQPAYQKFENPTFDQLDSYVRENIAKIIGGGVSK